METGGRRGSHGQGGGTMGKAAKTGRKRPGLTRRVIRSMLRVGMLATAVLVGGKTAGGGKARDGRATRSGGSAALQGPGAAAADQVPLLSAGVAFYALLSLFPAIIAGVSIYGLVADPATVRDQIAQLTKLLSPETATLVGEQLVQVTSGANGALGLATVVGILTALWSASSGMKALITGVNLAYDETETRKFV